jgi:hypothetical protein
LDTSRVSIEQVKIVATRVQVVEDTFGEISQEFIHGGILNTHKSCSDHLEKGCLSDHPDVNLYTMVQQGSAKQLKRLRCSRY